MMIRPKPKDVSDAYVLLSVLADPEGCKARLDELSLLIDEQGRAANASREAAEKAAHEQKAATEAMVALKVKADAHRKNVDEYHAAMESLQADKSAFAGVKSAHDAEYKSKNDDLVQRERSANDAYRSAERLEAEAKDLMSKAEAMKAEYDMKLKRLKEMS